MSAGPARSILTQRICIQESSIPVWIGVGVKLEIGVHDCGGVVHPLSLRSLA
jgi:hypothetical protein